MLKQDVFWILVMPKSFRTLPEFSLVPDVGVAVDHLSTQHDIHKNQSLTVLGDSYHGLVR
jgi:hypothetical protein